MQFTADWFSQNIPIWSRLLSEHRGQRSLRYLEVGVFEGRSTCWLLENVLTGQDASIECIDTFEGGLGYPAGTSDFVSVRQRFEANTLPWKSKVTLHVGESSEILPGLTGRFDLAYIDGSHQAKDVLSDLVLCWRLVKPNGIVILDDYEWNEFQEPWLNPKLAINSFAQCYAGWYQVLHVGYQVALSKLGAYLPPEQPPQTDVGGSHIPA